MFTASLFRFLTRSTHQPRNRPANFGGKRRSPLLLERLEDRTTPTAVTILGSHLHTAGGVPEYVRVAETGTGEGNGADFNVDVGPGVYHLTPSDGPGVYGTFTVAGDGNISGTTGAAAASGNIIDFDLSKLGAITIFASDLTTATGRHQAVNVTNLVGLSYSPYVDTVYFPEGTFNLAPFDAGGLYGSLTVADDGAGSLVVTGTSGAAVATDYHTIHFDLSKLAAVTVFGSDIKTANGQQQTLNVPNFASLFGAAYATDTIYFPACTVNVTAFDRPGVYGSFTVADNGSGSLVVTEASGAAVATDNHTIHFDLSKLAAVTIFGSELITAPAYAPVGIQGFFTIFHSDPIDTGYFPACTVIVTNFDGSVQDGTFTVSDTGSGSLGVTATTGQALATDPHTIHFKADATFSLAGYNILFDGNSHTATGTATGILGENLSALLDFSATSHNDPGIYLDPVYFAGNDFYKSATLYVTDTITLPTDLSVSTQSPLKTDKSDTINATVKAMNADDLATLQALATGDYGFRFVFTDANATVTVAAALDSGSYKGGNSFVLTYENSGPSSPLNDLVTSANTSSSTAASVTFEVEVNIDGIWYDLGSEVIKAFLSKK